MWLFGQLDTVGESKVQLQTDDTAKEVASLLQQLLELQQPARNGAEKMHDVATVNGSTS